MQLGMVGHRVGPEAAVVGATLAVLGVVVASTCRREPPPTLEVSALEVRSDVASALNVLIVPASADYKGESMEQFATDADALIRGSTTGAGVVTNNVLAANPGLINFWTARQAVVVNGADMETCPEKPDLTPLGNGRHNFDAILILHRTPFRDCTWTTTSTVEKGLATTAVHEIGHSAFRLVDEWDGARMDHYSPILLDVDNKPACVTEISVWNTLHRTSGTGGAPDDCVAVEAKNKQTFYRAEGPKDAMSSSFVLDYGRADWVFMQVSLAQRLPRTPLHTPATFP
jgi:hypothetical protein